MKVDTAALARGIELMTRRGGPTIWAPNARAGGGLTTLGSIAEAYAELCMADVSVVTTARAAGLFGPNPERAVFRQCGRLRAEFVPLRHRNSPPSIIAPLNFAPLAGADIVYSRNTLYFDSDFARSAESTQRIGLLIRRKAALRSVAQARLTIVPSQHMRSLLLENGARPDAIEVVPHGTKADASDRRPSSVGIKSWQSYERRLLWVGNATKQKNLTLLAALMYEMRSAEHSTALLVTTRPDSSPYSRALYSEAKRLNVADSIFFAGQIEPADVGTLYHMATTLVIPSVTESYCLPVYDALARGCPIALSKIPTFEALATSSTGAVLFELMSPAAAAEAVLKAEKTPRRLVGSSSIISWQEHARRVVAAYGARS